jgi:hypothetical protein
MIPIDVMKLIGALRDIGAYGLLALAVIGGYRGWYVWRWHYQSMDDERREYKGIVLGRIATETKRLEQHL